MNPQNPRVYLGVLGLLISLEVVLAAPTESSLQKIFQTTILVQASPERIHVDPETKVTNRVVEIQRVFWGSTNWVGKTFVTGWLKDDPVFPEPQPPENLNIRDPGVWAMDITNPNKPQRAKEFMGSSSSFPIFKSVPDKKYEQALALAETIGNIANASADEQLKLLEGATLSTNSDISSWAIRAIGLTESNRASMLLRNLLDKPIPITAQMELDQSLLKLNGKDWIDSQFRLTMLERWIITPRKGDEFTPIAIYLSNLQPNEIPEKSRFLALLKKGIQNTNDSVEQRKPLLPILVPLIKDQDEAFRYTMDLIEHEKEPVLQVTAAYALMNNIRLDDKKIILVEELQKKIANEELQKLLDNVLANYRRDKLDAKLGIQLPEVVWSKMKEQLIKGNIKGALRYFSSKSVEDYRESFQSLGKDDLTALANQMGPISQIERNNDKATYLFESKVGDTYIGFPIQFVREDSHWKILEY